MKIQLLITLLLTTTLCFSTVNVIAIQDSNNSDVKSNNTNNTYNDSINKFTIEMPNGWVKNEKARFGPVKLTEFAPLSEIGKITGPKIRICVVKSKEPLELYLNKNYNRIKKMLNNFNLIENKALQFQGYPCYKIEYTWFKAPWYELKTISYTFLVDDKIFEFILTGTIKNVDDSFNSFYTSLQTFELIRKDGFSKKFSKLKPSVKLWVLKPVFSTFASENNLKGSVRSTINKVFTKIKLIIASSPFYFSIVFSVIIFMFLHVIMSMGLIIVALNDLYYFNFLAIIGMIFDWFKMLLQLFAGSIGLYF